MTSLSQLRASVVACGLLLTAASLIAFIDDRSVIEVSQVLPKSVDAVDSTPARRGHELPIPADTVPEPKGIARPAPPPDPLSTYRGVGAWVDLYDFAKPGRHSPEAIVGELGRQGVRTLYLQTGRWNLPGDLANQAHLDEFLHESHKQGISVVGWYLPGFGDLGRDMSASLAVTNYQSLAGDRFDGFGADIEDRRGVGNSPPIFHAQIVEYSKQLRAAMPGKTIAAIVPDAKNNERAAKSWAGFPWPEIAQHYDVIMPMGYWTVSKPGGCPPNNAHSYTHEVIGKTKSLMGAVDKPIHPIGGIADCMHSSEVPAYVTAAKEIGAIGVSLYDFETINGRPDRDAIWAELRKLSQ